MAWNGFPTRVKNAIINRLLKKHTQTQQNNNNETLEDIRPKIWIRLPYLGNHGENLVRTLLKKIQRCLKQPINKSRKSLVGKIWEAESAVPGGEGPQKSWGNNIRVRVRAPAVMDLESHVLAGLPHT